MNLPDVKNLRSAADGISVKTNKNKIFEPFFTTEKTGCQAWVSI